MRAAPRVLAETTVACTNAYRKRVTAVCRCYFPLEHIVFFVFLASEKFPPRLGGEEGFKLSEYVGGTNSNVAPVPSPANFEEQAADAF